MIDIKSIIYQIIIKLITNKSLIIKIIILNHKINKMQENMIFNSKITQNKIRIHKNFKINNSKIKLKILTN